MSKIREFYESNKGPLVEGFAAAPWEDRDFYANWLAQTYYYVVHSTRLIAYCGAFLKNDRLHYRFMAHIREESKHEVLAENDFKNLTGRQVREVNESPVLSGFYQSQVYWITMRQPISFYGYILCLEGLAVDYGGKAYERVLKAHGEKAAAFLRVHSQEDIDHLEKAFTTIESLSAEELEDVQKNFVQSAGLYRQMVQECAVKIDRRLKIAA